MNKQPKALEFAEHLENYGEFQSYFDDVASELRRLHAENQELLTVLQELKESADYWSEYDVPLGIVDRINAAIAKATKENT